MKKRGVVFCFVVFFVVLFSLNFVLGEVRINEVMYNPTCTDDNCEYIEIYSDEEINITFIEKAGTSNNTFNITAYKGFSIITKNLAEFLQVWSINTNITQISIFLAEKDNIWIYKNETLIDSLIKFNSFGANGNNKSLQYCSGNWTENIPTPGQQNNCIRTLPPICTSSYSCGSWTTCSNSNQTRICTNTTANCTTATHNITETQICSINFTQNTTTNTNLSIQLNWTAAEIINSDNFSIEVKAFNLLNYSYDLKIWLEFKDNDTIISDRYDENEEIWKSGTYFVEGFFSDGGNKTKDINLCLREDYTNFSGEAKIFVKLKKDNAIIVEVNYTINILPKTETSNNNSLLTTTIITNNTNNFTDTSNQNEIIRLGSKVNKETTETEDIKTEKNTIYKSKNEYIKEYAIYGFAILCVFLIILLLIDKK